MEKQINNTDFQNNVDHQMNEQQSRLAYKRSIIDTLFRLMPDSFFVLDRKGIITDFRVKGELWANFHTDQLVHTHIRDIMPSEIIKKFEHHMEIAERDKRMSTFEFEISRDKKTYYCECKINLLANGSHYIAVLRDITEQYITKKVIKATEERLENLLENAPFPVFIIRVRDKTIRYGNKRAIEQFNLNSNDIFDVPIFRFYQNKKDRNLFIEMLHKTGVVRDFEIPMYDWFGKTYWALISAAIVEFEGEQAVLATINDITIRKEAEEALRVSEENYRRLALFDQLTGAPNKNSFKMEAEKLLENLDVQYASVILDMDQFKLVNDLFGHHQGDLLLQYIAGVLSRHVRENELFARAEADQFYLLLIYESHDQLAERLTNIFHDVERYQIRASEKYHLIVAAGVYVIEKRNVSIDTIIDRSHLAVRKMKGIHNSTYSFYNDDIRQQMLIKREIENDMHAALQNQEFKVFVQPKYDLQTKKIVGGEALVRWQHPTKGLISPFKFISIFEQNGFITQLDMYIVEVICQKQRQWIDKGHKPVVLSVNQSKLHFFNPHYIQELQNIISTYPIMPYLLELEFTESAVFDNIDDLLDVMQQLRQIGFKLSIDDFGTGYSSLNMLKDVEVDVLKLDRGFIVDTANEKRRQIIIEAVINMAKKLSMTIVAEGIETKDQEDLLREIGCDVGQGYFFAKPMPIDAFYDLLSQQMK